MARDEFDAAGEHVQIKDLEGELVLFTPLAHVEEVVTSFGTKDAILTDLVVLSQEGQPEYEEALVFQGALIATLKRRIKVEQSMERDPISGVVSYFETTTSRRVLGVISKGEAKKGQSAPYILGPTTDEQKDLARAYTKDNPTPPPVRKMVRQVLSGTGPVNGGAVDTAPAQPATASPATSQPEHEDPFAAAASPADDPFAV